VTANRTLIGHKLNGIIVESAALLQLSLRAALDAFYQSELYREVVRGVSDMHCRSDGYLAEELKLEIEQRGGKLI